MTTFLVCPQAGQTKEVIMSNHSQSQSSNDRELRWFVEDYCGCGPTGTADPVGEACADAALMLAQQTAG
jgi:hypothetical protein